MSSGQRWAFAASSAFDVLFEFGSEFMDRVLHRPGSAVGQTANRSSRDRTHRSRDLKQQINVAEFASTIANTFQDLR